MDGGWHAADADVVLTMAWDEQDKLAELTALVSEEEAAASSGERPPAVSVEFVRDVLAGFIRLRDDAVRGDHAPRIAELERIVAELDTRVAALEDDVGALDARVATLEVAAHRARVVDVLPDDAALGELLRVDGDAALYLGNGVGEALTKLEPAAL